MPGRHPGEGGHRSRAVLVYLALLSAAALAVAVAVAPLPAPGTPEWVFLPLLAVLLVGATWLVVPYRHGESVDAVNLVEAALAPLLLAYPPLAVVVVAALSQIANGLLRRLPAVKTVFNTAMWSLAAGLGGAVVSVAGPGPVWPHRVAALLAALAVVGAVNNLAFSGVLALSRHDPLQQLLRALRPVVVVAWLGGWGVNVCVGLLFALAYLATPFAVVLFPVPLVVLHLAYRSYAAARADQARLAAAHQAGRRLAAPLQPLAAAPAFLHGVAECFDATAVELALHIEHGLQIHRVDRVDGYSVRVEAEDTGSLESLAIASTEPVRTSVDEAGPVPVALAAAGVRNCLAAPLVDDERVLGAIIVLDRGGFEGSQAGELAVLEALARETTAVLVKGRLLADVLEERRKLAEIVGSASDGICTFADDGTVLSWNPALERITGLHAAAAVERTDVLERLRARTAGGAPVDLTRRPLASLPTDVRLTAVDGRERHLTCSYSRGAAGAHGAAALIVVARDVTPVEEHEALRERFTQLVEADAARRAVVEQLQQAVVPAPVRVPGAALAAAYESSDPSAPTGGDLYDWQVLASGEVHIAVVDVLGHGVAATKDALAVIHTLRTATAAGTPLEAVIARTDALLRAQHPELVATVVVARYVPGTGRLRLVVGGHPPALVIKPSGEVVQLPASGGAVGWPGAGSDAVAETHLEPGAALVLYTDGLIEARKDILAGMETLVRHAAEVAALPADELAHQLLERTLAGAERRDDTLALVLRREPVPAMADVATWHGPTEAVEARALRRRLEQWLSERLIDDDDVLVVAAELLSNAVRCANGRMSLRVELLDAGVAIEVRDDGPGAADLSERGRALPNADAERGRGLFLVRNLSTHVDVDSGATGTRVRALIPCDGAPERLLPARDPAPQSSRP